MYDVIVKALAFNQEDTAAGCSTLALPQGALGYTAVQNCNSTSQITCTSERVMHTGNGLQLNRSYTLAMGCFCYLVCH
jgi:hypothetical protein